MRSLPLWGGALGFGGLLLNRAISGVSGGRAQSSYIRWFYLQRQPLPQNRTSHTATNASQPLYACFPALTAYAGRT